MAGLCWVNGKEMLKISCVHLLDMIFEDVRLNCQNGLERNMQDRMQGKPYCIKKYFKQGKPYTTMGFSFNLQYCILH